jgi:lipid A 3-O-deacylase
MKTDSKQLARMAAGIALAASLGSACALDLKPDGYSVQGAAGTNTARMAGVGLVWDWDWELLRRKAAITAHTELLVNHWRADAFGGGTQGFTQLVLLPTARFRLSGGRSPWFLEMGIGASWLDRDYVTPHRAFSTRWNFYDTIGVGHSFGPQHEHELGIRWVHVSNSGIKKPNPGQDFLQLRYSARF